MWRIQAGTDLEPSWYWKVFCTLSKEKGKYQANQLQAYERGDGKTVRFRKNRGHQGGEKKSLLKILKVLTKKE